jgi:hypothetical protein
MNLRIYNAKNKYLSVVVAPGPKSPSPLSIFTVAEKQRYKVLSVLFGSHSAAIQISLD